MTSRIGTFQEFQDWTLAVARGQKPADPTEPKIWYQSIDAERRHEGVRFTSLEAGAKLLSPANRRLLQTIARRRPRSVSELAMMTGRAEQNLLRTLKKLEGAGLVRFEKGEGRAKIPLLTTRKISFEIDLLADAS